MAPLQQQADDAGKAQAGTKRRRLAAAARGAARIGTRRGGMLPSAIFMTDPERTPDLLAIAARLPAGWGVIYRHFGAADRFQVGETLARICRRRRLVLLVSADPRLARRIGADGVHWPEGRLRRNRRHTTPPGLIETAAAHSHRALVMAARLGMDAAIVSTVFASRSASASAPMGVLRFRGLARASALPVYALGGVTAANAARPVSGARAHIAGWAAVEAVKDAWE
jgi:thiamine-phosphate pyrophosphorylase